MPQCDHECVFIVAHLWAVLLVWMLISPGFASSELSTGHSTQHVLYRCRAKQIYVLKYAVLPLVMNSCFCVVWGFTHRSTNSQQNCGERAQPELRSEWAIRELSKRPSDIIPFFSPANKEILSPKREKMDWVSKSRTLKQ